MNIQVLIRFFMWCTILNTGLLALSSLILAFARDAVYRKHSKWFHIKREAFDNTLYSLTQLYKILILVFNMVPWAVLVIIG